MKFIHYEKYGSKRLGVVHGGGKVIELHSLGFEKNYRDMNELIKEIDDDELSLVREAIDMGRCDYEIEDLNLLPPMEKTVHDVICVGLNYQKHYEEIKRGKGPIKKIDKKTLKTIYFSKRATKVVGHLQDVESHDHLDKALDYESELAIVIGKEGKNISKQDAKDYIFGYTIINDISARNIQTDHKQWYLGKSIDTFTVVGPGIVHKSAVANPDKLNIVSRVNGDVRQSSNTEDMIKDVSTIIYEISKGITLEAGDIIATGTPEGVGMGFDPPRYMKVGDVIECEVEGLGVLRNTIV